MDLGTVATLGGVFAASTPAIKASSPILIKLIDVLSKGMGEAWRPLGTYLDTTAQLKALNNIGELTTQTSGNLIIKKGDLEITIERQSVEETAITNMIETSIKQQINISEIVNEAYQIIESKIGTNYDNISQREVSEDWAIRFFDISKNIRDEELKHLWSAILADETLNPGSYNLRTLELLKNMSKGEAELFKNFVNLALQASPMMIIPDDKDLLQSIGILFIDTIMLEELNLVKRDLTYNIPPNTNHFFMFGDDKCLIIKNNTDKKQSFSMLKLTTIGNELYQLVDRDNSINYINLVGQALKHSNNALDIYYTSGCLNDDNSISYNPNLIPITI